MAMLLRNKLFFVLILICLSCNNESDSKKVLNELLPSETEVIQVSSYIIGNNNYRSIYNSILDSLENWKKNKLSPYLALQLYPYKLDSIICISKGNDKLITALLFQFPNSVQDNIIYLYGTNIKNKWYYFQGPAIVLPRQAYNYPQNQPLPFSKLHEIAMKEVFGGYLTRNWNGKWEINEQFFNRIEFQFEKWGYWDAKGNKIDNSVLSRDSLQKLYLDRIIYDKFR